MRNNLPSVSVIVPVFNVEPYVEDCIRSIIRQTYIGFIECIVVDDCGTDNSMAIVEKLVAEYNGPFSFKVLHHTHNRGLSAARNTGMDEAIGDYLFFLDSDDELSDDCIEKLALVGLNDSNIEIVHGSAISYPPRKPDYCDRKIKVMHATDNNIVRSCYYYHQQYIHSAWNKLFKSSFILQNRLRFCKGIIFEDVLWTFFLMKYAKNVCFVPDVTYYYRIRPNSIITGTNRMSRHFYYKKVYLEILNHLTPGYESEELHFYIQNFPSRYISCTQLYDDVFHMFWVKAWRYKNYACCKILVVAYLSSSKWTKLIMPLARRLKHPSLILKDINRVKSSHIFK